ncbi:hypothetical protein [Syntrophotalea acetylenica]|uniref:Uncharacterized protein n=1 Tax=Syntrophotalea acetylenica TaxID=29542 RepID=A0A1L3GDS5_SYNAC|nr:hypothetical protein [Syntrophotalea acetylenica]APG24112.1 hypothetical protein A7E75_02990 [Syntrophotalea acetylenica]APG44694.1 hypothetical protein A6070_11615 [Syntrophotalea acetylenica]APG45447.1 hypothetical protein A6070_14805 [Syntrophotalea acetylenica]
MSLKKLRKRLAIDQRNILIGTVLRDGTHTVRIRTSKGEIRDALKPAATTYNTGARLELRTDGRSLQVTGEAPLADLDGEVVYQV